MPCGEGASRCSLRLLLLPFVMRRCFLACGLLLVAGCDTYGYHPERLDAGLVVELATESQLVLTSDGRSYCNVRLNVGSHAVQTGLMITVRGIWQNRGAICVFDQLPSGTVDLPTFDDVLNVSIAHNGATDRYRIRETPEGRQLEAIETHTTRPGPR